MKTTIGTCGRCGGPVSYDSIVWMVGTPPPPQCERCHAIPMNAYGPTLPMQSAPPVRVCVNGIGKVQADEMERAGRAVQRYTRFADGREVDV